MEGLIEILQKNNGMQKYIRFDWAMKRLLRNKANFGVLEGFLTTLLGQAIHIDSLLESESNQEEEYDKYNRVDILAKNDAGQLFLIEVQNNSEYAYFQRMLFGTSKLVTEYIDRGQEYDNVKKIYSINIVYFSLGNGTDTVYHGKTEFRGLHNNDLLALSPFQQQKFNATAVSDLYPEYFILKVNDFNKVAKTPLEEWIYYLNTGELPEQTTAPGLDLVRERLKTDRMSKAEYIAYCRHLDNIVILRSNIVTEREEGHAEGMAEGLSKGLTQGRAEGRAEGLAEGRAEGLAEGESIGRLASSIETARKMKADGMPVAVIAKYIGLTESEIAEL